MHTARGHAASDRTDQAQAARVSPVRVRTFACDEAETNVG